MVKLNNVEKDVKRFIKRKVSVTMATMVVFLMTGAFLSANTVTVEERINSVEARMTSVENNVNTFSGRIDNIMNNINNNNNIDMSNYYDRNGVDNAITTATEEITRELADKASSIDLESKADKNNVYSKEEANGKFALKSEYNGLKAAHEDLVNTINTYNLGNDEWGRGVDEFMAAVNDDLTAVETSVNTLTDNKLDKTEASRTYTTKDEYNRLKTAHDMLVNDITDYNVKNDEWGRGVDEFMVAVNDDLTAVETSVNTLTDNKLDKTEASRTYTTKDEYNRLKTAHDMLVNDITDYNVKNDEWGRGVDEFMAAVNDDLTAVETSMGDKANINGDNINTSAYIGVLSGLSSLDTPIGVLVTDTTVKAGLDKKVDKQEFTEFKDKLKNAIEGTIAGAKELAAEVDKEIEKKANKEDVYTKEIVDNNIATAKNEVDTEINKLATRVDTLEMAKGTAEGMKKIEELKTTVDGKLDESKFVDFAGKLQKAKEAEVEALGKIFDEIGAEIDEKIEAEVEARETAIGEAVKDIRTEYTVADTELTKAINDVTDVVRSTTEVLMEADQGLKNEIDTKANAEDVYTKTESDARFVKIEGTVEEQGGTITTHTKRIEVLEKVAVNHETRIDNLEVKTDKLEKRIDSVASITAAMTTLDLGSVPVGQLGIGISFGASGKSQAVAAGLGFAPTENFKLNAKFSTSTGKERRTAVGAGAVYYLNLK